MKETIRLQDGWMLKQIESCTLVSNEGLGALQDTGSGGKTGWLTVKSMPAQVQDVLLDAGIIETPWLPGKAEEYRWIWDKDWVYRLDFQMPETGKRIYIHCKGLDTCADIYLNGVKAASCKDMFLPLRVDITSFVTKNNILLLHFKSPFAYVKNLYPGVKLEQIKDYARYIRKKHTDFVDHIGPAPYYAQMGVYDDVQLELVEEAEISELDIRPLLKDSCTRGEMHVKVSGAGPAESVKVRISVASPGGEVIACVEEAADGCGSGGWSKAVKVDVENPLLWWPRGYGGQFLYSVEAMVSVKGEEKDSIVKQVGFRKVTMPSLFDFHINGKPVKLRGGNLTPFNQMTKCWDGDRVRTVLDLAENCNMNILRIWSLGDVYKDVLYAEADKRGILLWQDMFHIVNEAVECRELARKEAEHLVKRLKHHPSILLWCGGNEHLMFHELSKNPKEMEGYTYLDEIFRDCCTSLDPDRYYHLESPSGGAFPNDPLHGNTHGYTNMWYVPGYEDLVFASEDTRVSAPGIKSLRKFLGEENIWPVGYSGVITPQTEYPWPDSWIEYTIKKAFWWKKMGPVERFYDPVDAESLVYRIGAAHGLYYKETVERCRRGRVQASGIVDRRCKGYILWKFNASWPQIYSAIVDYFLEPYIPYYMVKRAYAPVLLSFDIGNHIVLWAVNDTPESIEGRIRMKLFDFAENKVTDEIERKIQLQPGESRVVTDLDGFRMIWRECALYACLEDQNGQMIARANEFLEIERNIKFPDAKLQLAMQGDTAMITADKLARCVELTGDCAGDEFGWLFEDNYFDLLPGEIKKVKILGRHKRGIVRAKAHYSEHAAETIYAGN